MLEHTETVIINSYRDIISQDSKEMQVKTYDSLITQEAQGMAKINPERIARIDEVFVMIEHCGTQRRFGREQAESVIIVTYTDNTKEYHLSINSANDYEYRKYYEIHPYYIKKNYMKIQDPLNECTWWMAEYLLMKGFLTEDEDEEIQILD
jgi:hypothetical protein